MHGRRPIAAGLATLWLAGCGDAAATPAPSRVLQETARAFRTMTVTRYEHHPYENRRTGTYLFDCVGAADYFLRLGAPRAWSDLHATLHIRRGYVPRPRRWGDYLRHLSAAAASPWRRVTAARWIRPGDFILMDPATGSGTRSFVGHAMIAAGDPHRLSDGGYALDVYDATGTPHGPRDTRVHDPRALRHKRSRRSGSGLGHGTVEIWASRNGRPDRVSWAVGRRPVPTRVVVGRPRG